ncbi:MAG: ribosome biogenesis GTPase Der [Candidatus Melainabacteria bacterium]|nr:ribosome biogenesis GTPase Der [Candidatus Melainabacteria bacterium]
MVIRKTSPKAVKNPVKTAYQRIVAVVGRPNVGKSTLVNRIIGQRETIVDDMPGVTRDRTYHPVSWQGQPFVVVDTGGLIPSADTAGFDAQVNDQVAIALAEADVIVFLVDGQAGVTEEDSRVAKDLRQTEKAVLLVVNKLDSHEHYPQASEFYTLGLGDPLPLSALHGSGGVGDMLDAVVEKLPPAPEADSEDALPAVRIALVGRPNVGKSSIVNAMVGEGRTLVSEVAGTTRDAVDVPLVWNDRSFVLVDTAGIRRKSRVEYGVEAFSVDRSLKAMKRSDVTVLVLDAAEGVTDQDKRIITLSNDAGRALVLVINKWDTIPDKGPNSGKEYLKKLRHEIPHADFASAVFTSAATGQRLPQIFQHALMAYESNQKRIQTSILNQIMLEAQMLSPPPAVKNKRLKVYYATQIQVAPPTIILFVNDFRLMKDAYRRYLERKLRESVELTGTPIRFLVRNRSEKENR